MPDFNHFVCFFNLKILPNKNLVKNDTILYENFQRIKRQRYRY